MQLYHAVIQPVHAIYADVVVEVYLIPAHPSSPRAHPQPTHSPTPSQLPFIQPQESTHINLERRPRPFPLFPRLRLHMRIPTPISRLLKPRQSTHRFPSPGPARNKETLSVRGVTHKSPTSISTFSSSSWGRGLTELRHEDRAITGFKRRRGLVVRREEFRGHLVGDEHLLADRQRGRK